MYRDVTVELLLSSSSHQTAENISLITQISRGRSPGFKYSTLSLTPRRYSRANLRRSSALVGQAVGQALTMTFPQAGAYYLHTRVWYTSVFGLDTQPNILFLLLSAHCFTTDRRRRRIKQVRSYEVQIRARLWLFEIIIIIMAKLTLRLLP